MSVLVTGGAGYIGSHTAYAFTDRGESVFVLDNLSTGNRKLVPPSACFVEGDCGDRAAVRHLLREGAIDTVIHFAGSIVVPESVEKPLDYYENNVVKAHALLSACCDEGVKHFIFSSTAAIYGETGNPLLRESDPPQPMSPYARSKLMTEWMLEDVARAYPINYVCLRYFNVAGADPAGRTGQSTPRATHLIKRASQTALGQHSHLDIFGTDYPTPDGTGIRDYIHVSDLANAHLLALDVLRRGAASTIYNCGYGRGASVREVIAAVEKVLGRILPVREMPRRAGDPAALVADPARIKAELGWQPCHDTLEEIVATAYAWERSQA